MEALDGDLTEVSCGGTGGRSSRSILWRHWMEILQKYLVETLDGDLTEVYCGGTGGRSNRSILWRHWMEI